MENNHYLENINSLLHYNRKNEDRYLKVLMMQNIRIIEK